uniref:Putative disintegrin metalloproteinases with thrombospondin repeat n=1 Tax=Culex tarsalis TaxID=7177 RepID=A0A1Q3G327_CULTA
MSTSASLVFREGFWIVLLLAVGGLISTGVATVHVEHETSEHQGLFTHHLKDAQLVIPRKVSHRGALLSHRLVHFHDSEELGHRKRRAIVDERLHYHVDVDDQTLHLELEPSTDSFVAPLMVVERHRRDLRTRSRPKKHVHNCHYQGHIRGHEQSRVALSTCHGLTGFLRTNKTEYWIEPSKNHVPSDRDGHPHVLFKRTDVKEAKDVRPKKHNPQNGAAKKKRKRRKKRHANNCGTREPRRVTETRLEWQHQGKVIVQGGRKTRDHPGLLGASGARSSRGQRIKRSISTPRHVEALVVADLSMSQFHQDVDLPQYLLTIMNMVSSLYKDPTIGNSILVTVVRIIIMEEEQSLADFNVTHVAANTLENFCKWQREKNPKQEDDPHHHDVAILVTRKNICSTHGCSTLGVANVGGMCRPDKSCSVNEDNGITLAHTISHELGHNFGMYHDTAKTGCDHRIGPILHIMTPSFEADTVQVSWSNCSRRDITHFLDLGLGKCLEDPPNQQEYIYPELPPGAMYNADLQCRQQFNSTDEEVTVCSKLDEICVQLWCLVDEVCMTNMRPAAPGTHCGKHKWCQNQQCVDVEDLPAPVDGGWGGWSPWSECSRSCGAGVARQTRECDHPSPAHGGLFCTGERARYKTCNTQPCPPELPSFRAQQCSEHDNQTIKGQTYTWLPYFDKNEPCELYCTNSEDTIIMPFGDSAADGTPCNLGTNDMCIGGLCRRVGCDWVVDSNTTVDKCGVCGGREDSCTVIQGNVTRQVNASGDGYEEILQVPAGARNILVEEMIRSKNYIGIGKANGQEYYLNGNRHIQLPGEYEMAGSLALYERDDEQERVKIPGPITDDIVIAVIMKKKNNNTSIRYEYTLPSKPTPSPHPSPYYWKLADWSLCSATCGGGKQHRESVCHHRGEGIVVNELCEQNAHNKRHDRLTRVCNEDPCPANWWVGPWQLCSVTCRKVGGGDPATGGPVRKRSILCVDQTMNALPDDRCDGQSRPPDHEPCAGRLPLCKGLLDAHILVEDIPPEYDDENNVI